MCGIGGLIGSPDDDDAVADRMRQALHHRVDRDGEQPLRAVQRPTRK